MSIQEALWKEPEQTEILPPIETVSGIVKYLFASKEITKKIVKDDSIIFYLKKGNPITCEKAVGKRGQNGVKITQRNFYGKVSFTQFFSDVILA